MFLIAIAIGENCSFYFNVDPSDGPQMAVQVQACFDRFFLVALRFTATPVYRADHESEEATNVVEYATLVQCVGRKEDAGQFAYR